MVTSLITILFCYAAFAFFHLLSSFSDLEHFDAVPDPPSKKPDPDPTSENKPDSNPALYKFLYEYKLFATQIFAKNTGMAYKTYF
jgi:hypothetical protein